MKSKLTKFILSIGLPLMAVSVQAQYTLIPDPNFEQALIDLGHDSEGILNGQILTADAASVTELSLGNSGISDLAGIEAFTFLEELNIFNNSISSCDLSNLSHLQEFIATSNQLTSIDFSGNPQLTRIYLPGNQLSSVDLSGLPELRYLLLSDNNLSALDLTQNPLLVDLRAEDNPLTTIDLSQNPNLLILKLSSTNITSIDLSNNIQLGILELDYMQLTTLDLSSNSSVYFLKVSGNQLTELDLSNQLLLEQFFCFSNQLESLDIDQCSALFRLNASFNALQTVDMDNGNNSNFGFAILSDNPDLSCVEVDDPVYAETNFTYDAGVSFSTDCGSGPDCSVFISAPVDLSKSFNPVGGVQDRVQLKWYKESPKVKYTDEDAAMCDIKAWAVKELDPITGQGIGPVIQNPDTISLVNRKKTYGDDSPRSIFKWPLFFRADGANNDKRVEPNMRYKFKVRCECGHDGGGLESPWSVEKFFNTPDFDPVTGINTAPPISDGESITKNLENDAVDFELYPNPTNGGGFNLRLNSYDTEPIQLQITDITGKALLMRTLIPTKESLTMHVETTFSQGVYFVSLGDASMAKTKRLVVR